MAHTKNASNKLNLTILKNKLAICRLDSNASIDNIFDRATEFLSVTRTADELSIVCDENYMPKNISDITAVWRAFKVDNGPLYFSLVGILSGILNVLAEAGISVFTVSTFNTDYILVKEENLIKAIEALKELYLIKN